MTPILAFDIETVPDVAGLRILYGHAAQIADADVAKLAFERRREVTGSDFLQLHLHRVIAISCALRDRDSFRVWSLGEPDEPEQDLIRRDIAPLPPVEAEVVLRGMPTEVKP